MIGVPAGGTAAKDKGGAEGADKIFEESGAALLPSPSQRLVRWADSSAIASASTGARQGASQRLNSHKF
jgi:hypothetical protein